MKDSDCVNVYDTDAKDPYHEIKGWLQRNGYSSNEKNRGIFKHEVDRMKKDLCNECVTWDELNEGIDHSLFTSTKNE